MNCNNFLTMNLPKKLSTHTLIAIAFIVFSFGSASIFPIGSFTLGIYTGISPNMNDIGSNIMQEGGDNASGTIINDRGRRDFFSFQNQLIQNAVQSGASGKTFESPVGFHFGLDFRYNLNLFFFRVAIDQESLVLGRKSSLKTSSYDNKATINSFSANIPLTMGIRHAFKEFIQVNIGAGPYLAYSYLDISHSDPQAFTETILGTSLPTLIPFKSQNMSGFLFGYHLLLGLQIPIIEKKYYLSIDYIYFSAHSFSLPVNATDSAGTKVTGLHDRLTKDGANISIGFQYYISM